MWRYITSLTLQVPQNLIFPLRQITYSTTMRKPTKPCCCMLWTLTSKCKRILFSIPAFRDRISGGRKKSSPRNTLGKPAWSEKVFRESPQKSRWIARLARKSIPVRVGTGWVRVKGEKWVRLFSPSCWVWYAFCTRTLSLRVRVRFGFHKFFTIWGLSTDSALAKSIPAPPKK